MPRHKRRLLVEAALMMCAAKLALATLPFRRVTRWMGPPTPPGEPSISPAANADVQRLRGISWAIATAAPHLPFATPCLVRALAGHAMCRRRGLASIVHFGAPHGRGSLDGTHAWLDASGVRLAGYPLDRDMVELGCFPWPAP
ncbi:hypothetical protein B2G71_23430 [Novosphingobium sp. PC22D]|nr:hypothetical protein B2G71_23430 [Novosphingobium sp. PC22D]